MAKQAAKKVDGGGSPRWVIALGALVGAGTLAWAVASHFIPKAEAPKPAAVAVPAVAPASPAIAASVSVSGTQNFAASVVNDSTIIIGAPAPATGASR